MPSIRCEKLRRLTRGYSSAWLTLGLLQLGGGDRRGAQESFLAAVRADPKFALPLIQAARLDASQGNWNAVRDHSQKAIDLNPEAFPDAWALNALGNLSLAKYRCRGKERARRAPGRHAGTTTPNWNTRWGVSWPARQQIEEATQHLRAYIDRAPHGM